MKLHKQLKWLHPYFETIEHMVPLKRVNRINMTFYSDNARPSYLGECTAYDDETFSILVKMPECIKDLIFPHWAQDEVLCHLAHELSHLVHWEHTPERLLLESLIYHQFAVTVSRLGYEEKRNKVRK